MFAKINNRLYRVRFSHPSRFVQNRKGLFVTQRQTICTIELVNDEHDQEPIKVGSGVSTCSTNDNFEKAVGREVSLSRALESVGFTRAEIHQFNQQIFSVMKHSKANSHLS